MLDEEALYSTTDQTTADRITSDIAKFVPRTATITDATACAGGNTYSFSQYFEKVYAFELDQLRARMLRHNMTLLGASNVIVRQGDAFDLCMAQYQDVVFVDPPWGGPGYKKHSEIDLYMSGKHIAELCEQIIERRRARFIALKSPTNFNEAAFIERVSPFMTLRYKDTQLRKMFFYIFEAAAPEFVTESGLN
jgi:16S rRNA G966 N2-methylase RsmD